MAPAKAANEVAGSISDSAEARQVGGDDTDGIESAGITSRNVRAEAGEAVEEEDGRF